MKQNGFAIKELVILFAFLGVVFGIAISKISYALEDASNTSAIALQQEENLELAGIVYAQKNPDKFTEAETFIYGSELVDNHLLNDIDNIYQNQKLKISKKEDGTFSSEIVK